MVPNQNAYSMPPLQQLPPQQYQDPMAQPLGVDNAELERQQRLTALLHKRLRGPQASAPVEQEADMRAKHEKHLSGVPPPHPQALRSTHSSHAGH